jgi:hypothetical protein
MLKLLCCEQRITGALIVIMQVQIFNYYSVHWLSFRCYGRREKGNWDVFKTSVFTKCMAQLSRIIVALHFLGLTCVSYFISHWSNEMNSSMHFNWLCIQQAACLHYWKPAALHTFFYHKQLHIFNPAILAQIKHISLCLDSLLPEANLFLNSKMWSDNAFQKSPVCVHCKCHTVKIL